MEFDKLFKLVVNSKIVTEAEAAEDAEELADDSILSDDDLGTAEDSALDNQSAYLLFLVNVPYSIETKLSSNSTSNPF